MAYDVSGLVNYVKENESVLLMSSIYDAKTQQLIQSEGNVQAGIKSSEKLAIMETDAVFQAGGTCGFNASGTTTISQRSITVGKIKINESLCPKSLETKYTQKALQAGSRYESIPFEQEYSERKAAVIAKALEVAVWQGDTASGTANLNKFDGLIKLIDAASPVNGNPGNITAATGITTANVIGIVDNMWQLLPDDVKGKDDVRIFCGFSIFERYVVALRNANLFHHAADMTTGELVIPGTGYKLTAVPGLNNTNRLFSIRTSNMYLGVDMLNEEDRFEIFYAKEADEVRFVSEFKMGVQLAFPNEVVSFKLVP